MDYLYSQKFDKQLGINQQSIQRRTPAPSCPLLDVGKDWNRDGKWLAQQKLELAVVEDRLVPSFKDQIHLTNPGNTRNLLMFAFSIA